MSKELDEKKEKLKRLEEILIPSIESLIETEKENMLILVRTVSIEEAYEIYLRGDATQEEYENYVRDRSALERAPHWMQEFCKQLDSMKQEVAKLKSEIAKIEKDIKREKTKERRAEIMKKIFGR